VLQDALHAASEHLHLAQQAMQQPAQPAAPAQQQQQQQQQEEQQQQLQQAEDLLARCKQAPQLTAAQFVASLRLATPAQADAHDKARQQQQQKHNALCAAVADAVRSIGATQTRTNACRKKLRARTLVPLPAHRMGHVPLTTSILAALHQHAKAAGARPGCTKASLRQLAPALPDIPSMLGAHATPAAQTGGSLWRSWFSVDQLRPECKQQGQRLDLFASTDGVSLHVSLPRKAARDSASPTQQQQTQQQQTQQQAAGGTTAAAPATAARADEDGPPSKRTRARRRTAAAAAARPAAAGTAAAAAAGTAAGTAAAAAAAAGTAAAAAAAAGTSAPLSGAHGNAPQPHPVPAAGQAALPEDAQAAQRAVLEHVQRVLSGQRPFGDRVTDWPAFLRGLAVNQPAAPASAPSTPAAAEGAAEHPAAPPAAAAAAATATATATADSPCHTTWAGVGVSFGGMDPGLSRPLNAGVLLPPGKGRGRCRMVVTEHMAAYRRACGFPQAAAAHRRRVQAADTPDSDFAAAAAALRQCNRTAVAPDKADAYAREAIAAYAPLSRVAGCMQARRWRLRVAKRRVRHFHRLARRLLLSPGGALSPGDQPPRVPGVWTRATHALELSRQRQQLQQQQQQQQQESQQQQQQQQQEVGQQPEVRERLVVVAMGDSGSGAQSALPRAQGAPLKAFAAHLQAHYSDVQLGRTRTRLVVSADEWMTSQVHSRCLRLNSRGRGLRKHMLCPLPLKQQVVCGDEMLVLPWSPRRRYAHTLLACKGMSSSTGASKCAVVHRDHNAADNIAHIMQLQALLAGCERLRDLPPHIRMAVTQAAAVFRQVQRALPAAG
jgi:hypothetical protein